MLDIKEIAKKARNAGYDYSILDTKVRMKLCMQLQMN